MGQKLGISFPPGGLNQDTYKIKLKEIHTSVVRTNIFYNSLYPVLNEPAPPIHKDEQKLPRKTRSTLSQLRSLWDRPPKTADFLNLPGVSDDGG